MGKFRTKDVKLFSGGGGGKGIDKSEENSIIKLTGDDVIIPKEKLKNYCLSFDNNPDKARTFQSVLGFTAETADILEIRIRRSFSPDLLKAKGDKGYGMLYEAILPIKGINNTSAYVTTSWIDDKSKNEFRLTSAYINTRKGKHII